MFRSLNSGIWVSSPEQFIPEPQKTVCITGHRAKSIIPYDNDPSYLKVTAAGVRYLLNRYIDMAFDAGYTTFFDGLATGTDLWAAAHLMNMKRSGKEIRIIGVMPFRKHALYFREKDLAVLAETERSCDVLLCTCSDPDMVYMKSGFAKNLYRDRNFFMADNSSTAIAFFNKDAWRTGTGQTISRMKSNNCRIASFDCEDVHKIIDITGNDVNALREYINEMPNIFTS